MKEVILYGGSFDPPHMAHLQCLVRLTEVDFCSEVWITPSGQRIDKPDISSFEHRAQMCNILAARVACLMKRLKVNVRVETAEGSNETKGSWELIQQLRTRHPSSNFSLAIGSDLLKDLPNWRHPDKLKTVPLVVLQRYGATVPSPSNTKGYLVREIITQEFPPLSSSAVRDLLVNQIWDRLGPDVLLPEIRKYIVENQLYGLAESGTCGRIKRT